MLVQKIPTQNSVTKKESLKMDNVIWVVALGFVVSFLLAFGIGEHFFEKFYFFLYRLRHLYIYFLGANDVANGKNTKLCFADYHLILNLDFD